MLVAIVTAPGTPACEMICASCSWKRALRMAKTLTLDAPSSPE
jgi:hypothetical protein